ncbi:FecCD family ABC transporter permease [Roseiterribacter gracilis]|uniref:ABC transporter permease n=1 Tax=Roseiterribacter gracilis TaxID=2812848 RepID=A0A8S8X7C9_9PROT|nr:ABC transporter permease [Rhodospirillales bacterium TMPK1]
MNIRLLSLLVCAAFFASLAIGPAPITLGQIVAGDPVARTIFLELRLPRALLGLIVGGGLGLAGAALQGWLRNPLVEPGLIGASSGASLGAVLALYSGLAITVPLALPIAGTLGAAAATGLLWSLAGQRASATTTVLAGVAIASLGGALTSLALNLAPSPLAALEIVFWLLGSLADRSMPQLTFALPFAVAGAVLLFTQARELDALSLGDETAASLGVDLGRVRIATVLGAALVVGPAVAITGAIGFVGLVVPHLLRTNDRQLPSRLLLPSMLGGAALLTFADIAVRLIPTPQELKLGTVTALIGAPFFLWLLRDVQRRLP